MLTVRLSLSTFVTDTLVIIQHNPMFSTQFLARQAEDLKIVCYYGAWSVYRPAPFNFSVSDIDPFSCTHLIYSFAGLDPDSLTIMSLDTEEDITKGRIFFLEVCNMYVQHALSKVHTNLQLD